VSSVLERPSVQRVHEALRRASIDATIRQLDSSARSALEAAQSLGVSVGQIASSIVFRLPDDLPLLVITSGSHRVDADLVARALGVGELLRADADYVKAWSGFSIGGVSPLGWAGELALGRDAANPMSAVTVLIDDDLANYEIIWAAAGHPHAVFPTSFPELSRASGARAMTVAS